MLMYLLIWSVHSNNGFSGYLILGTRLFFFHIVGSLLHYLLGSVVSLEKPDVSLTFAFMLMNISEVPPRLECSSVPLKYA